MIFTKMFAAPDPLPSWNDGPSKNAIINFVRAVTSPGTVFVPLADRIAVFDEDGTLWVEQPMYTEVVFAIQMVLGLSVQHPDWAKKKPFSTIIDGDLEGIKSFTAHDIALLIAATHTGMDIDKFHDLVASWLKVSKHPRFQKLYTELIYKPMLEVMDYLKQNQFQVFIVSGGGQEFMRSFADSLYQLPPGHIIGSTGKVKYEYKNGKPLLEKIPEVLFVNDKQGKPEGINLFIGKKPIIAFGNSTGDQQMLEWTQSNNTKTLNMLVNHDDPVREYAYGPNSKIGTFSVDLMNEAHKQGWHIISMKNDWKEIFAP